MQQLVRELITPCVFSDWFSIIKHHEEILLGDCWKIQDVIRILLKNTQNLSEPQVIDT